MKSSAAWQRLSDDNAPADGASSSWRSQAAMWMREIMAGAVTSVVCVVLNVGAAQVVFHAGSPLGAFVGDAINMSLLSSFVGTIALSLFSGVSPIVATTDGFMCTFYATMCSSVLAHPAAAVAPFGTVAVALAISTAAQGTFFYMLGVARIGKAVEYAERDSSLIRARHLLVTHDQPPGQEIMSSHLAAGSCRLP
jgi:MFS superfamily sulfate permease-like transporter